MAGLGFNVAGVGGFNYSEGEKPDYGRQDELWARDVNMQREFARHGVSWRVADAKEAGVHPVWSLSGGGAAYAPSAVSVGTGSGSSFNATMGQDVSRAAQSTMTPEQRLLFELELETKKLQRDIVQFDLTSRRGGNAQVGPGMPSTTIPGDMFAGDMTSTQPATRLSHDSDDKSLTAAFPSPSLERYIVKNADGGESVIYLPATGSGKISESLESLGESNLLLWMTIQENLQRDPGLIYKLRHLVPFGESMNELQRSWGAVSQGALNRSKAQRASKEIARQWWERHRSDTARGHGLK